MAEPLLVVEGLDAYYGSAHVLQDVSLTMGAEPVALIGRNGMGKSTLCKALAGVLGPGNRVDRLGADRGRGRERQARAQARQGRRSATSRRAGGCSSR